MTHLHRKIVKTDINAASNNSLSTTYSSKTSISPLLLFNISMYTLATICFMIYTTELNYAHADEDLGSASSSIDASVTVGAACNFSGNVDIPHTSTIMNGINSTDIGKTTLNVTCNDQGGYAVYAIGYTNDEYGNTTLQSSISDDYNIPTGTSTSGNTSNWSMKLSTVPGTTTATIENGYNNYHTVPDDFTKVATLNTITDPGTSTTGSSISTTYQAYISPTQPASTYTGKVKYTLVHPSTAPAPEKPIFMQDTATIKQKLANVGDEIQAIDKRDGKKYWVTKLADGNIWMTQNLDLELDSTKTYTPADTDIPASWTPTQSTITAPTWCINDINENAPQSCDPGDLYWDGTISNNVHGTLSDYAVTNPSSAPGGTHYHIGNYYNWTAAVAMNDSSSYTTYEQDVDQSICPAGWRLPNLSENKSYINLRDAQSLTSGTNGNIQNAPTYFVYGGCFSDRTANVGYNGVYWSSVVYHSIDAYALYFGFSSHPDRFPHVRYGDYSVRCVAR